LVLAVLAAQKAQTLRGQEAQLAQQGAVGVAQLLVIYPHLQSPARLR
jgi:hypothetical protein